MKLQDLGRMTLDERTARPFAVAFGRDAMLFDDAATAERFAVVLSGALAEVTRLTALTKPEHLTEPEIPGWWEVTSLDA